MSGAATRRCRTRRSTRIPSSTASLASIQATQAGADEALMLDPHGFVATCNSTHFFIVRKGEVWTSSGKYCLGGITRGRGPGNLPRGRHTGHRKGFLADRRLRRRRGLRHRHLRRASSRCARSTDGSWNAAGRWSSGCSSSTTSGSSATWRSRSVRDHPHRHVVGATKPLHGDDAQLRQPDRTPSFPTSHSMAPILKATGDPQPMADEVMAVDGLRLAQRGADT